MMRAEYEEIVRATAKTALNALEAVRGTIEYDDAKNVRRLMEDFQAIVEENLGEEIKWNVEG